MPDRHATLVVAFALEEWLRWQLSDETQSIPCCRAFDNLDSIFRHHALAVLEISDTNLRCDHGAIGHPASLRPHRKFIDRAASAPALRGLPE
jgi:hypothetical protein